MITGDVAHTDSRRADSELVRFVREMYGAGMSRKVAAIFKDDDGSSAFVESVRRSLTRELNRTRPKGADQ